MNGKTKSMKARPRTIDGERLRMFRLKVRWSQQQLQAMSGVSWRTIGRIEAGNDRANLSTVKALETALNVSLLPQEGYFDGTQ